jgi:hypothetical protein
VELFSDHGQWLKEVILADIKDLAILPYILESNPHPNLIRTQVLAISTTKKS